MDYVKTANNLPKLESGRNSIYNEKGGRRLTKGTGAGDIVFSNHLANGKESSVAVAAPVGRGNNLHAGSGTGDEHGNTDATKGLKKADIKMDREAEDIAVGSFTNSHYTGSLSAESGISPGGNAVYQGIGRSTGHGGAESGMSPGRTEIATNEEIVFSRKPLPVKMKSHGFASSHDGEPAAVPTPLLADSSGAIRGFRGSGLFDSAPVLMKDGTAGRRITWPAGTGKQSVFETGGDMLPVPFLSADAAAAGTNDSSKIIAESGKGMHPAMRYAGTIWQDSSVAGQIGSRMVMLLRDGIGKAAIHLDPPELGKIKIEIITKDQMVRAHIATEHPVVKGIIEANLGVLKDAMNAGGLTLDNLNVSTGGSGIFGNGENTSAFTFFSEGWANNGGMSEDFTAKSVMRLNTGRDGADLSGGLDIFV